MPCIVHRRCPRRATRARSNASWSSSSSLRSRALDEFQCAHCRGQLRDRLAATTTLLLAGLLGWVTRRQCAATPRHHPGRARCGADCRGAVRWPGRRRARRRRRPSWPTTCASAVASTRWSVADLIARPTTGTAIRFEDWRVLRSDFIVVGQVEPAGSRPCRRVRTLQRADRPATADANAWPRPRKACAQRPIASQTSFSNGSPAFRARSRRESHTCRWKAGAPAQRHRLVVADADGYGPRVVTESNEPIMSPAWSPDGQNLAYVSFEGRSSAIYVQRLASGERRRVSARLGINGAPAWSPDGRKLALTLSRDGNLDIYVLDLASQGLTRLTTDGAIDTEPEWSRRRRRDLFHVGSGGQRPGVSRRREQRGRRAAAYVHEQLQRATAHVPGRSIAGPGHARPRRLPHRDVRPEDAQPARTDRRARRTSRRVSRRTAP